MNSNWSYSLKTPNLGQIRQFLEPCEFEVWRMTLKNNRAPFLSNIKPYASFHHHLWIQTGVTVQKRLSWIVTFVTLTFDLWPWPFAWISHLSLVITPENCMVNDDGNIVRKVSHTDRRTDWAVHRAAWSQLKISQNVLNLSAPIMQIMLLIGVYHVEIDVIQWMWYFLHIMSGRIKT